MIAAHEEERRVQHAEHVLQIVVGQVAAADDEIHAAEPLPHGGAVDGDYHFVAKGQDSHRLNFLGGVKGCTA